MLRGGDLDDSAFAHSLIDSKTDLHRLENVVFANERSSAPQDAIDESRDQVTLPHSKIRIIDLRWRRVRVAAAPKFGRAEPVLERRFGAIDHDPMKVRVDAGEVGADLSG